MAHAAECALAALRYSELVDVGNDADASFWQRSLRGQMFLGDDGFARRMQAQLTLVQHSASGTPRVQRPLPATWTECLAACEGDRNRALCMAYRQGRLTMPALALLTRLSVTQVSRLIGAGERTGNRETPTPFHSEPSPRRLREPLMSDDINHRDQPLDAKR